MKPHKFLQLSTPCFIHKRGNKTRADFITAVQALRARIRLSLNEKNPIVVLHHSDRFEFAVRLFALALEQCVIVLPINGQSKSLQEASVNAQFVIGEIPRDITLPNLEHCENLTNVGPFQWPEEAPLIFMTSGSTDSSKKIEKNWLYLNRELEQLSSTFAVPRGSAVLSTVSHQHIYGLLFGLLWPLQAGQSILPQVVYPEHAITYLNKYAQTILVSSPAFLSRLVIDNVLISSRESLVDIFSSGGPLDDQDAIMLYSQLNVPVTQVYGSTETGGIAYRRVMAIPPPNWQCFENTLVDIEPITKQILLTSPLVDTKQMPLDDRAEKSSEGTFRLLGRLDRTVKLEEKRINLTQMEQRCQNNNAIVECKILVIRGQRTILAGVVVLSNVGKEIYQIEGNRLFKKRISSWLSDYYEHATLPRKWRIVESLPYNDQGKIPQDALEALFV